GRPVQRRGAGGHRERRAAGRPPPHPGPARARPRTRAVTDDVDPPAAWTGRVRVTGPLTSAPAHVRRSVRQEIDESTSVGEVYMRSLIRSQLRAALTVATTLMLSIGAL